LISRCSSRRFSCRDGAQAIDNVTSRDAPDLTSVRAKIKAKDFKAAMRSSRRCWRRISTPTSTT
jgi:hypothetical protein